MRKQQSRSTAVACRSPFVGCNNCVRGWKSEENCYGQARVKQNQRQTTAARQLSLPTFPSQSARRYTRPQFVFSRARFCLLFPRHGNNKMIRASDCSKRFPVCACSIPIVRSLSGGPYQAVRFAFPAAQWSPPAPALCDAPLKTR
jgi:hypothetical protein